MTTLSEALALNVQRATARDDLANADARLAALASARAAAADAISALEVVANTARAAAAARYAALASEEGAIVYAEQTLIDGALRAERRAGWTALVAAIRANPAIDSATGITTFRDAAQVQRGAAALLHAPSQILLEYRTALVAMGKIAAPTWPAFTAYVVATPDYDLPVL